MISRGCGKTFVWFEEFCEMEEDFYKLLAESRGEYPRHPGMSEIYPLPPPSAFDTYEGWLRVMTPEEVEEWKLGGGPSAQLTPVCDDAPPEPQSETAEAGSVVETAEDVAPGAGEGVRKGE